MMWIAKKCVRPLGLLLATAALPSAALAGGVPAGTIITGKAIVTFESDGLEKTLETESDPFVVHEVVDVAFAAANAAEISVQPGQQVFAYDLSNPGNGPEAYIISTNGDLGENDFPLGIEAVAIDSNGNGTYDAGIDEALPKSSSTAELGPDKSIRIFVATRVPEDALDNKKSQFEISARAETGFGTPGTILAGKGAEGSDAIIGMNTATASHHSGVRVALSDVELSTEAAVVDPYGGTRVMDASIVTYTIVANVTGSAFVEGLILRDRFPVGTTYRPGTLRLDGAPLSDAADEDAGAIDAKGIQVKLGKVDGGKSHTVAFEVRVNEL